MGGGGGGGSSDPYFANVVALLHCDGANGSTSFPDVIGHSFAASNVEVTTAESVAGGASMLFNNNSTSEYVEGTSGDFGLSGDFTIEFSQRHSATNAGAFFILRDPAVSTYLYIWWNAFGLSANFSSGSGCNISGGPSAGLWRHIAFVRSGSSIFLFKDGALGSTNTNSLDLSVATVMRFGGDANIGLGSSVGFMDEIRVTKGVARYTSNFTPPTVPYPNS